jgi:hypothetical protein
MAVVLLTAPIEGAPFHRAHSGSSEEHPAALTSCSFVPSNRVTGLPFTARVGKELELSLLKGSSRTVLHCAH